MKIDKNEKGPLQRFKNQNLLLRKFGETALAVYRAIDGKRSFEDLQKDISIDSDKLQEIIDFMAQNEMVLVDKQKNIEADMENILGKKGKSGSSSKLKEQTKTGKYKEDSESKEETDYESKEDEELRPTIFEDEEIKKLKEDLESKEKTKEPEDNLEDLEIKPEFEFDINKEEKEEEKEKTRKKHEDEETYNLDKEENKTNDYESESKDTEYESKETKNSENESEDNEFTSNSFETDKENKDQSSQDSEKEEKNNEFDFESKSDFEEEEKRKRQKEESEKSDYESFSMDTNEDKEEKTDSSSVSDSNESSSYEDKESSADTSLSPVEKIIFDKYGQLGLKVYTLIDGQRTAEEIMRETGLIESKLVEMLDFMDEQGIIKLDYPKAGSSSSSSSSNNFSSSSTSSIKRPNDTQLDYAEKSSFNPLLESEGPDEAIAVPSPLEVPTKVQLDLIRGIQLRAKVLLKYGEKGNKVMDLIDSKNDLLDISFKTTFPLYLVYEIVRFLIENGMAVVRPLQRAEVRKKYGDAAYSVYKRYGKEGLMLYELIGKDMSLKEMAEKITTDKNKIIEMFVFIQNVLGMEGRVDKEAIARQLQ